MTETPAGGAYSVRSVINEIWYRARINAFAHRAAATELTRRAKWYFTCELGGALLSIFLVICVYFVSTVPNLQSHPQIQYVAIGLTAGSIVFTLTSLFLGVMANYLRLEVLAENHRHSLNSYQYIAQRAREAKWPDMPNEDVVALLKDLERDFQLLKARATEPEDRHFDEAHAVVSKVRSDPTSSIAQSFPAPIIRPPIPSETEENSQALRT